MWMQFDINMQYIINKSYALDEDYQGRMEAEVGLPSVFLGYVWGYQWLAVSSGIVLGIYI